MKLDLTIDDIKCATEVCVGECLSIVEGYANEFTSVISSTVFPRSNAAATNFFPSAETSGDYSRAATKIITAYMI